MFYCYYRHSDKHYKKSTHGVAIPRDEFLYQGSSSIVSIVKAEIFLRYFFVQFIQSRVFVSVAYFRQLIQPDLESRFIVRSHLGPSIQSGFSLSARLHDPPTYRRTVTPTPPPQSVSSPHHSKIRLPKQLDYGKQLDHSLWKILIQRHRRYQNFVHSTSLLCYIDNFGKG